MTNACHFNGHVDHKKVHHRRTEQEGIKKRKKKPNDIPIDTNHTYPVK